MTLTLHLDVAGWREHLRTVRGDVPGLVPVAKGNGYGFGLGRLAAEATALGVDTLAVGTSLEVAAVRAGGWTGDIVVLTPWSRHDPVATELLADPQVITTISRVDDLAAVAQLSPGARIIAELLTSMRRHGMGAADLGALRGLPAGLKFEGWTIHLPMRGDDLLGQARDLARVALNAVEAPLWLSHLPLADYTRLASEVNVETRLRMGTPLWLGAPATRRTTARVLDVHPVRRGERVGYWQRRTTTDGWVVVVSGGTANGVALSAPTSAASMRQRLMSFASGFMDASGLALSPYTIAGRKRFFVEPPHMQSSLVFLPGAASVAIGDEVPVEVRLTTATVDQIVDE